MNSKGIDQNKYYATLSGWLSSWTSIASEIPGIDDISPPTTFKVKSNFFYSRISTKLL